MFRCDVIFFGTSHKRENIKFKRLEISKNQPTAEFTAHEPSIHIAKMGVVFKGAMQVVLVDHSYVL